ncbi:MAG TPA: sigma-70 family RNA polymerase sigma factor [Thermoanaerobaculia bacterium]|nr:sigma-70 family RNA polymerase sigma factor [Thermoanaerobaculia bacterium]
MTPEAASRLFSANAELIDALIDRVCRHAHMRPADAEDFGSVVKLALIEDDYAILRAWEQRSALSTYLTVIIQRLHADERSRTLGRWEPSAEARRIGKIGVLVESMIVRDGRSLDDVLPRLNAIEPALTIDQINEIVARLPKRTGRPKGIPLDDVETEIPSVEEADARALASELGKLSDKASRIVRDALAGLPLQDRMIVRLRFGEAMSIADISRMMNVPQRPLYRKMESVLEHLRRALTQAGIRRSSANIVVGSPIQSLDFGLNPEIQRDGETEENLSLPVSPSLRRKSDGSSQSSTDEAES